MPMDMLTANFSSVARSEMIDGKEYLVAPSTLLVDGVHEGTSGGILYKPEEYGKGPEAWDKVIPITLNHPIKDGEAMPASSGIAKTVGFMRNSTFDGKLRTELCVEKTVAQKEEPRLVLALNTGTPFEISTGLLMDIEESKGVHNGTPYAGIARNIRPDHLAILMDKKGACDLTKGCGGFVFNEAGPRPVANEMSLRRILNAVSDAVDAKFGYTVYPRDVYDGFVIYSGNNGEMWKLSYTEKDGKINLGSENPVAVKWVTEYRTTDGTFVGNCSPSCRCKPEMNVDKKQKADTLIANHGWPEAQRTFLMGLEDSQLDLMIPKAAPIPVTKPVQAPVANQAQALTLNQFLEQAPPELRGPLMDMHAAANAEKGRLVANITANPSNTFTQEWLMAQTAEVLRGLTSLTGTRPASTSGPYGGQATIAPVLNQQPVEIEPLAEVEYNFR